MKKYLFLALLAFGCNYPKVDYSIEQEFYIPDSVLTYFQKEININQNINIDNSGKIKNSNIGNINDLLYSLKRPTLGLNIRINSSWGSYTENIFIPEDQLNTRQREIYDSINKLIYYGK